MWLMSDFYGRVLVEPTPVEHERGQLTFLIDTICEITERQQINDLVVAIERTGNYHTPLVRAFKAANWKGRKFDIRIVHPFATKQHRQPANPGDKTDENDLAAIFRAVAAGYGLLDATWDDVHRQLHLLARHRRDLVEKRSAIYCQLREHLDLALPGYAALFDDGLWISKVAFLLLKHVSSPDEFQRRGIDGLTKILRDANVRFQEKTLGKIIAWSANAAAPDQQALTHHRILLSLEEDRQRKTQEISALEEDLAHLLVNTPYLLLLCCPGINVISAAELAGEMGPITNYARAANITGRAGLYRSRYQSDDVDLKNGPLVRMCNRRLRAVLMMIAENLVLWNPHYRSLAQLWESKGQDDRYIRTKIATKFSRLLFQLVAGRQILRHPGMKDRDYILDKLMKFQQEHGTRPEVMLKDLQQAILQLPTNSYAEEAAPLAAALEKTRAARPGVKPLADVLPLVLARLGVGALQSQGETREPN
jgi:transposase